jgi:homoserine kinase type II
MQLDARFIMAIDINEQDVACLLSMAEIPEMDSISPMQGGWSNTNLLLTLVDGSNVVLKAWDGNTVEEVGRVIQRHTHLDAHGIPTPVPLELSSGNRHIELDGVAWALVPHYEGGLLGSDTDSLRSLGEVQARMHLIPINDCFPEVYTMGFEFFKKVFSLAEERDAWSPFLDLLRKEAESLEPRIPHDLPCGILHGDLFPDNVIGSDGEVAAILDLEEAWIGPLAFDLVMSFVGFGWEDGGPLEERWCALLEGYESVRALTEVEWSALPYLNRYATLAIAGWRYWKHVMSKPDSNLAERYLEMAGRLDVPLPFLEGHS